MLAVAALGCLLAAATGAERLGVFQIGVVGADPALAQTAIDAIATSLADAGFAVVSRSDLDAMLGAEKLKDAVGCSDVACMAEIGAAAGVERIVAGSVSRLESGWVVSLQLVNTRFATVENRVTLEWPSTKLEAASLLGAAAELVALPAATRGPGSLRLAGIPVDAAVSVDGAAKGLGVTQVADLAVGVHTVRVEAPGFETWTTAVAIRRARATPVDVSMIEAPAFYTRWWFWGAAAAVVGGGVVAVVLATRSSDPSGTDNTQPTASGTYTVPSPMGVGGRR
jgi:hypothetical protein